MHYTSGHISQKLLDLQNAEIVEDLNMVVAM